MKTNFTALLLLVALLCPAAAWPAGQAEFVAGKVSVVDTSGQVRMLNKGGRISAGDTLVTGSDGEAHVVLDDSALVALRANTRLKIEDYRADGTSEDKAIFRLFKGAFRSITGWVGRNNPANYEVRTATATIGVRGTDHEPMVVEEPERDAGTYDKVNEGGTLLRNPLGEIKVEPNQAAFVPKSLAAPPRVLPAIPALYRPTSNEKAIDELKARLKQGLDERLEERRRQLQRQGADRDGKPRICDQETGNRALASLREFIAAYESGNIPLIQNRLNPAMLGYQKFLDGVIRETNAKKQIRLHLADTRIVCGPDLASIDIIWEKRSLSVPDFSPRLESGRSSILMHRGPGAWNLAAVSGDNPFAGSDAPAAAGRLATLNASVPGGTCAAIGALAGPGFLPFAISVVDPDRAGAPSVTVTVSNAVEGDSETLTLPATSPAGEFQLGSVRFDRLVRLPATPGNGALQVRPTGAFAPVCGGVTVKYVDTTTPTGTQTVTRAVAIP